MFLTEKLVYTELHKTAGSHIGKLLAAFVEGEQIGKHNIIPRMYRDRFVLGSIRNPWDWYVSLWAYGCDHKGSVWQQTTNRFNFYYYRTQLPREMGCKYLMPNTLFKQVLGEKAKPLDKWAASYSDSTRPDCFQAWLKLMFDKKRQFDIREGYGFSPIASVAGLLTYRFFKLFTNLDHNLYSSSLLNNHNDLKKIWNQRSITNRFIRMENLENDLLEALAEASVDISQKNKQALLDAQNKKTNTSSRYPASHYYSDESIALISKKERFLINLFDYKFL